jgi:Raf kinase inhibitor-like YbhB/YbcL family protein
MRHPLRIPAGGARGARARRMSGAALGCAAACVVALAADTQRFSLASADLAPGRPIASRYVYDHDGCRGDNRSPALSWRHPPAGTRSFALLMHDPDAPGGGWWHWVVFDIPAAVRALPRGAGDAGARSLPRGALETRNDFGTPGYGGPCPPPGPPHHYHLVLYALPVVRLGLAPAAGPAKVAAAVRAHALAKVEIVAPYGR